MADRNFEAFLWSLTQQESGGNYGAIGPAVQGGHHAYGRYQIMDYNIGSWTAKYYGRRLTPQEFLRNHEAQDAAVRGVLGGYYRQYGARGAAAMWYSGQPNPNKTYGNPPVYQYVNSIMSRAAGYDGQSTTQTSGGGGGGPGGLPGPTTPKLSDSERAEQYGFNMRLINSSKELKRLFQKAVSGSWSPDRFMASLKSTGWWRNQSKQLREYITLKHTDPATFKQNWRQGQYEANRLAVEVGWGNQINKKGQSSRILKEAVYNMLALGWSKDRIKDWLAARVPIKGAIMWGEVGETFDKLHELAYLNGMRYGHDRYARAARDIVAGKRTLQDAEAKIRKEASARYSAFAEQIKAGMNVLDLASPYIKSVSQLLEIPESDVDVFNKYVAKAMSAKTKDKQPYSIWALENDVRNDPLWRRTNNARESAMGVAHEVAKQFGMAF